MDLAEYLDKFDKKEIKKEQEKVFDDLFKEFCKEKGLEIDNEKMNDLLSNISIVENEFKNDNKLDINNSLAQSLLLLVRRLVSGTEYGKTESMVISLSETKEKLFGNVLENYKKKKKFLNRKLQKEILSAIDKVSKNIVIKDRLENDDHSIWRKGLLRDRN